MARPRKPACDKKTKQINFRVTEAEYKSISEFCEINHNTVAELVKAGMAKYYKPSKAQVDKNVLIQLARIGNNVNQISKNMNQSNFLSKKLNRHELEVMNQLTEMLYSIRKQLL